eukprot:3678480-Prymnesium_polylepis.1
MPSSLKSAVATACATDMKAVQVPEFVSRPTLSRHATHMYSPESTPMAPPHPPSSRAAFPAFWDIFIVVF